jgi:succinoglycan biosynthesis protein ExoM
MLRRLLRELKGQETGGEFTFDIVVADNDDQKSAREVVKEFAAESRMEISYCVETCQNIAMARNCAVARARGEFIALIDDDEFPSPTWLQLMLKVCKQYNAAGVLGPVRPHFELPPPRWIIAGGFCERPDYSTGRIMDWEESRSGNLLFKGCLLDGTTEPFKPEFGNGGEDKDFFMRMTTQGHVFRWCSEAIVYETVPPARWERG